MIEEMGSWIIIYIDTFAARHDKAAKLEFARTELVLDRFDIKCLSQEYWAHEVHSKDFVQNSSSDEKMASRAVGMVLFREFI